MSEEAKKAAREWMQDRLDILVQECDVDILAEVIDAVADARADARVEEAVKKAVADRVDREVEMCREAKEYGREEARKGIVAMGRDWAAREFGKSRGPWAVLSEFADAIERREDLPKAEEKCGRCGGEGETYYDYPHGKSDSPDCSGTGRVRKQ